MGKQKFFLAKKHVLKIEISQLFFEN